MTDNAIEEIAKDLRSVYIDYKITKEPHRIGWVRKEPWSNLPADRKEKWLTMASTAYVTMMRLLEPKGEWKH